MFNIIDINASSIAAHKEYLSAISNNIANINTSVGINGNTYKRQAVVFSEFRDKMNKNLGVKASLVKENKNDRLVYDPANPVADANGNVHYPDIDMAQEMTDLITAQRGYEANLSTINVVKDIYKQTLDIGR